MTRETENNFEHQPIDSKRERRRALLTKAGLALGGLAMGGGAMGLAVMGGLEAGKPIEGKVVGHMYDDPDDVLVGNLPRHDPEHYKLEVEVGREGDTKVVEVPKDEYGAIHNGAKIHVDSEGNVRVIDQGSSSEQSANKE